MNMSITKNSTQSVTEKEQESKEIDIIVKSKHKISNEKKMQDRALHLFAICHSDNRRTEVMSNCIRIAMHELGDEFYIEIIRLCNSMDILMSDYINSQVNYLLKTYYGI